MFDGLKKLGGFARRARIIEVGRDRLRQVRHQLSFVLVTEDLSENSLDEMLNLFECPVYRHLSMSELEDAFGYQGTKILGFRRSSLSNEISSLLKGCGVVRRKPLPEHPKVAVLGASGIGRHHANWWNMEGASPIAFLGSSPESVEKTREKLHRMFGFEGRGYVDLAELLSTERPDIVDVCLPPRMHYAAVKQALEAGCHVLCEKPFVYDDDLSHEELLDQARELGRLSGRKGLMLGVCTQYVMVAKEIISLWKESHPGESITEFVGHLVSPTRDRPPVPHWTWVDLSPHMLGVAQVLSQCGELDWSTLRKKFEGHLAEAEFQLTCNDGKPLSCRITTFHTDEEPENIRQITLNGTLYDIGGRIDENNVFQMDIFSPDGMVERPDMLRLLIRSFLNGKVEVPPAKAIQNLEWMLRCIKA